MPILYCVQGEDVGRRFNLSEDDMLIGRDTACQIVLSDGGVSRRHCRVQRVGDGYVLTNLSQTNGTLVNQRMVDSAELSDRDDIVLGTTCLRFLGSESLEVPPTGDTMSDGGAGEESAVRDMEKSIIFYGEDAPEGGDEINLRFDSQSIPIGEIENQMQALERLKAFERRFSMIREIGESIVSELELDKLFELILDKVFDHVQAERGCILIYDEEKGEVTPRAVRERDAEGFTGEFPMSRTICQTVLRDRVGVLSTNAMADKRFSAQESVIMKGIRSVMSAPMIYKDNVLGIISVDNSDMASAFSKDDLETLLVIANLAATAIHNAELVQEHVRARITRENFSRFLPPSLVKQVTEEGRQLSLGGETANVTVLFVDIRSFTPMCESRRAEEIVSLLNVYFHEMTQCVFHHRGTLDKYVGDSVMAVFGSPEPYPEHALKACRAALEMRGVLFGNEILRKEIQAGIGLHRGDVIHGFVGSRQRLQYTVIGDTVNTASRLCDVAEGGQILISPSVVEAASQYLISRPLPAMNIQGKSAPINVHELIDLTEEGKTYDSERTRVETRH